MKIKLTGQYKSLANFESDELSDFCIITGKNGSGKSQLLEAIKNMYNPTGPRNQQAPFYQILLTPFRGKLQFEGINLSNTTMVNSQSWENKVRGLYTQFINIPTNIKPFLQDAIKIGLSIKVVESPKFSIRPYLPPYIGSLQELQFLCQSWGINLHVQHRSQEDLLFGQYLDRLSSQVITNKKSIFLAEEVANYKGKHFGELVESDFFTSPISELLLEENDLFNIQVEGVFFNYAKKRYENAHAFFNKATYSKRNNSMSDVEFVRLNTPPWEIINNILDRIRINYNVAVIAAEDFSLHFNYSFHLIKKSTAIKVEFANLSSGEKIIIGLVLKLFLSSTYQDRLQFPDYLFLDEPDANLHPEMSQLLLNVLYHTFSKEMNIHVVMTTHDPSTIALAPEDCIYELQNEPSSVLRKISKDAALKTLTQNLPSLSIDYKNHRQVFVESPTDVLYYQTIFNKCFLELKLHHRLYFISHSSGKGNADGVVNLVSEIRKSGNKSMFGAIDWDEKNSTNVDSGIFVHGEMNRYSIENFIFDPLLLTILFLEQKGNNINTELNLDTTFNQYNLGLESCDLLQRSADWLIEKIKTKYFKYLKEPENIKILYHNGKSVQVPKWFLLTQGHELLSKLIQTFPSIQQYERREIDLMNRMIEIMGKSYPLVPVESIKLIQSLAS
jgi:AAA15 family ATPase/GTPase